jgi:predicted TIM-barrel fold metal-dependent hydrolase
VDFGPLKAWPKPVQQPSPPVLVGGTGTNVFKRVLRFGDGWMPYGMPVDSLRTLAYELRVAADAVGRREPSRAAERGARAIAFSENPTVPGLPSIHTDHWNPLWAAIQDTGLPICKHIGSSSRHYSTSDDAPGQVLLTLVGVNAMMTCADWIFSGVFERSPRLKIVLSEGGAGLGAVHRRARGEDPQPLPDRCAR